MAEQTELTLADLSQMLRAEQVGKIKAMGLDEKTESALIDAYESACAAVSKTFYDDFMLEISVPSGTA